MDMVIYKINDQNIKKNNKNSAKLIKKSQEY